MSKQYTFGAKYIAQKIGLSQYQEMAQCLPGKYETPEWEAFAKKAAHALNTHGDLLAAIAFAKAAKATLDGYERDLGEELPDDHEIGRIEESRDTPSFRIRVGHIRMMAAALDKAGPALS